MAIAWTIEQETAVREALEKHGVASARCANAATLVLPVARERDAAAVARRCDPRYGRFVHETYRWFHHVSVCADAHYLDALTGPPGLESGVYMKTHWTDSEAFAWSTLTDAQLEELAR